MENHTAKHFVLQLGSLISLYLSLSFLLVLLFGIINIVFPLASTDLWQIEEARTNIRIGIAMLIVFLPTYMILTRVVNKLRRQNAPSAYLTLTKWLIYLSLLIGTLVLLVDLVVVIMTFLEGDLTERFLLKAAAILIVVGAALSYYILDARGYWLKQEKKSYIYAAVATLIALVSIGYGFTKIETPSVVREQKLDEAQIQDLRDIQWQVQEYYVLNNNTLPASLDDVSESYPVPTAPEGRAEYEYKVTDTGFALCAEFAQASKEDMYREYSIPAEKGVVILNPENWQHKEGNVCFERKVAPPTL